MKRGSGGEEMKGAEKTRGKRGVKKKSRAGDKSVNYYFSLLHNRIILGKEREVTTRV